MFGPVRKVLRALGNKLVWLSSYPYNRKHSIDLSGDRLLEWLWVSANIPEGTGNFLDFGWGGSMLPVAAKSKGYKIYGLDRIDNPCLFSFSDFTLIKAELLDYDFGELKFDVIANCSSVEHAGLAGRYDYETGNPDGDLQAMRKMKKIMNDGAKMILTIPVGKDTVYETEHRIYGAERLPLLLEGYSIQQETFFRKNAENMWEQCPRESALSFDYSLPELDAVPGTYALGCFILTV